MEVAGGSIPSRVLLSRRHLPGSGSLAAGRGNPEDH